MKAFLVLALVNSAALASPANWTPIMLSQGEPGSVNQIFVDKTRVNISGEVRRAWSLIDKTDGTRAQALNGKLYLSMAGYSLFDCKNKLTATMHVLYYGGQMGTGEVVDSFESRSPEWRVSAPNSVGENTLEAICGIERPVKPNM